MRRKGTIQSIQKRLNGQVTHDGDPEGSPVIKTKHKTLQQFQVIHLVVMPTTGHTQIVGSVRRENIVGRLMIIIIARWR